MKCANPRCLGVELKDNDTFCPWCGEPVNLHIRVSEFVADGETWSPLTRFFKEERPRLRLEVIGPANVGLGELSPATSDVEWLRVGEWQRSEGVTWAGLTYLPDSLTEGETERSECALLAVEWPNAGRLNTELRVYPSPCVMLTDSCTSDNPRVLLRGDDGEIRLPFALKRCGNLLHQVQAHLPKEVVCGKDDPLPRIDWQDGKAHLRGEIVYTVQGGDSPVYPVTLALNWKGRIGADPERSLVFSQELTTYVRVIGRPQLKVLGAEGRTSWSVLTNRPTSYALTVEVTNRGRDSKLRIRNVRLGELPAGLKVELSGDLVSGGDIVNTDGKATPRAVSLRLTELPAIGNYDFTLVVTWYDPVSQNWQQTWRLIGMRVGDPRSLPGSVLAVDFGTSSSCVAMWGLRALPEMITVETEGGKYRAEDPYSLASVALFTKDGVEVGEKAVRLSFQYPLAVLESPKRDIGRRDGYEVLPEEQSWKNIPMLEAVELFYTRLIACAQDCIVASMGSIKDDWNCINFENLAVSHPSRFSYAQKQIMKEAAERAFARVFAHTDVHLEMVQEPLAAALSYVSDQTVQEYWHTQKGGNDISYSLLVYDCGGGTTDLCCLQVHSQRTSCSLVGAKDFSQLTARQRGDLMPQAWKRMFPKANSETIEAWCRVVNSKPDWPWAWSEVPELRELPTDADKLVAAIEACANEVNEGLSYTVEVCIKGASGDPTFGGSHITDEITAILLERFPALITGEQKSAERRIKARRNAILLRSLAESLKRSVGSDSEDLAGRIVADLQGTLITSQGNVSVEEVKTQVEAVSRGLYRRLRLHSGGIQTRLANLGDECLKLSQRCLGNAHPDVVLLTGRGSQWPGIRDSLEGKFPKVPIVSLGDACAVKHCVARGAGVLALVKSGSSLAKGPGVHIVDIREDAYTTCSLVLQSGTDLVEIIGAGCRFDEQGLIVGRGTMWLRPSERQVPVTVYQSDVPGTCQGNSQTMQREGVRKVGTFTVEVPPESAGNAEFLLELRPSQNPGKAFLQVELVINEQSIAGQTSEGENTLEIEVLNK